MASVQAFHHAPPATSPPEGLGVVTAQHNHQLAAHSQEQTRSAFKEEDSAKTPTTASFAEANGKRSLPLSPPPPTHATIARHVVGDSHDNEVRRPTSQRSNRSVDSSDLHGTEAGHTSPENDVSDGESVEGDASRPTKKKKGQRFFCTDFPPCNLSFTRSEHLARHIRKHTGERPFQCHCNRRFSRLDNLRQHAQTVHINEDIPGDSLAATGTRFQRQIRTDRVRPAGARPRASTTSSATSHHGRGHSRNLSTSSIASTVSNASTISTMSQDPRYLPLLMAPDQQQQQPPPQPPANLTIDTHRASNQYSYAASASGGPPTPTSTIHSNGPGSPFPSFASPASSTRYPSYDGGVRHARRLSVPNGPNPYHGGYSPAPMSPSGQSFVISNGNSTVASPTSSVFSGRQELTPTEAEIRRRTWHPSTYSGFSYQRPATSGLSYSQTPDAPQPAMAPQAAAAASQPVTLPGFRDLVNTINRPATPPGQVHPQQPSNESPARPPLLNNGSSSDHSSNGGAVDRPNQRVWDVSLHQNLNRLDITSGTPPREMGWGQQTMSDINHAASSVGAQGPTHLQPPSHMQQGSATGPQSNGQQATPLFGPPLHLQAHGPQPVEIEPSSPNRNRRQGWYNNSIAPTMQTNVAPQQQQQQQQQQRISPASSISEGVPTPSNPSFEHHPTIVHVNGFVEGPRHPQQHAVPSSAYNPVPPQKPAEQAPLSGFDALVAAATARDTRERQN